MKYWHQSLNEWMCAYDDVHDGLVCRIIARSDIIDCVK